MDALMTDAHEPYLRVGIPGQQAFSGREDLLGDFKGSGVYVNRDDVALVPRFHQRAHLLFVEFRPLPSMFFLRVSWLSHGHGPSPLRKPTVVDVLGDSPRVRCYP